MIKINNYKLKRFVRNHHMNNKMKSASALQLINGFAQTASEYKISFNVLFEM
jgi:hypothetical protein